MLSERWGLFLWVLAPGTGQLQVLQVLWMPPISPPQELACAFSMSSLCLSFPWGPDPPICSQLQNPELPFHVSLYQRPGEETYNMTSVAKNEIGGL